MGTIRFEISCLCLMLLLMASAGDAAASIVAAAADAVGFMKTKAFV